MRGLQQTKLSNFHESWPGLLLQGSCPSDAGVLAKQEHSSRWDKVKHGWQNDCETVGMQRSLMHVHTHTELSAHSANRRYKMLWDRESVKKGTKKEYKPANQTIGLQSYPAFWSSSPTFSHILGKKKIIKNNQQKLLGRTHFWVGKLPEASENSPNHTVSAPSISQNSFQPLPDQLSLLTTNKPPQEQKT